MSKAKEEMNFLESIIDSYGEEVEGRDSAGKFISTGCLSLDMSIGTGGIPVGRFTEVYGSEGCLSGDTFIQYSVVTPEGRIQNRKGGTLENLYCRYNNILKKGQGYYLRKQTVGSEFYVSSVAEDGHIIKNFVENVVYSGKKETFKVTTNAGNSIICTKDHRFLTVGSEYIALENLKVGNTVFVHNNYRVHGRKERTYYPDVEVKNHPSGNLTIINKCTYYRVRVSHLVFEAHKNGYSTDEYRYLLNTLPKEEVDKFWTVPLDCDIHHIDSNPLNNVVGNLELIRKEEHYRRHSLENIRNFSFIAVETKITSIEPSGEIDTYDVSCKDPYNNFVANGIVVHNSAKTTIALTVARNAIRMGKRVLYVEPENLLDYNLVEGMIGEIFPKEMFILLQPNTAEDTLSIMEKGIASGEFGLIVLDSLGALASDAEQQAEITDMQMGTIPKLLAKFFRRNSYILRTENKTAVLLLNQVRDNIGSYSKGFSVPGGHALKHFCSIIIALTKGQEIKHDNVSIGITTTFVIKKNKLSSPFRGYTIPIIFGKGVDFYKDFVSFTEDIGVITKAGPFYKFDGEVLGKGVLNTIELLKSNPEILTKITERTYKVVMSKPESEFVGVEEVLED